MRVLRHHTLVHIAVAICLLAGAASADPSDPLPAAIRTLEADGKLADARQQVTELKPPLGADDLKAHLELIDKTTNLLGLVDVYVSHKLTKQATEALTAFLPSVSQARDGGLAIAVQRRLAQLQSPSLADTARQAANERDARDALTRADTYFDRRLYSKAKTEYDAVAKQMDPISEETRARAKRGVAKASQELFGEEPHGMWPTLYRSLGDAAVTVRQWLLTFLVVLAGIFVLRRVWLTNKRSLELVDHSLPAPSSPANRELTQELQDVIDRIRGAGPGSAKLDASGAGDSANEDSGELPRPDLVFVTAPVDAPELAKELDAFVSSTPTIQFAGIGLNPAQLWTFVKRMVTPRPRHAFIGTLTSYDNTLTLRLTQEDRLFGTKTELRASAPSASSEARISCLVDIASRIILDGRNTSTATSDCHSLKEYILGLYAFSTASTPDALKTATAHFQAALDIDEHNWLARFQLALCARGRKDTRTAIKQLTWFTGPEAADSETLQSHIERHPDFPHVVQYQLASTLSLASDDQEDTSVGTILDGLIALETNEAGTKLDPAKRLRLVMLARSGQCTREAVRASLIRDESPGQTRTRQGRARLRAHLDWFDQHADELQRAAPTGHPLARGIVLHAYGRMQFASGDRNGAIESLSEAVDLMPTYADVHVDLAKACLERKGKPNWPQRVIALLDRALTLDPANAKAKFVYARFYFAEETRDFAKAEPYLAAAPFDPASLFMLAQALNRRAAFDDTLKVLDRAIALQEKGPPFRVRLYADSLLELVRIFVDPNVVAELKPKQRALERARRQLCEYDALFDDEGRTSRNYERVSEIYAEICSQLKAAPGTCFQRAPAPESPPLSAAEGGVEPLTT